MYLLTNQKRGNKMITIDTIQFNDGYLELQQDTNGHYLTCAVGETAHKYFYKFLRIEDSKLPKAFKMFNNCLLVI